jgi:hypothetical protein
VNGRNLKRTKIELLFTMVNNTNRKIQCLLAMNFVKHNDKHTNFDKNNFFKCQLEKTTFDQQDHKENVKKEW